MAESPSAQYPAWDQQGSDQRKFCRAAAAWPSPGRAARSGKLLLRWAELRRPPAPPCHLRALCSCYRRRMRISLVPLVVLASTVAWACARKGTVGPGAGDVESFLRRANDTMYRLGVEQNQASWVEQNFITSDTEALAARANQRYIDAVTRLAKEAVRFDGLKVSPE